MGGAVSSPQHLCLRRRPPRPPTAGPSLRLSPRESQRLVTAQLQQMSRGGGDAATSRWARSCWAHSPGRAGAGAGGASHMTLGRTQRHQEVRWELPATAHARGRPFCSAGEAPALPRGRARPGQRDGQTRATLDPTPWWPQPRHAGRRGASTGGWVWSGHFHSGHFHSGHFHSGPAPLVRSPGRLFVKLRILDQNKVTARTSSCGSWRYTPDAGNRGRSPEKGRRTAPPLDGNVIIFKADIY